MTSGKTKTKSENETPSLLSWDDVRKKKVLMFQTLRGPMMGRYDKIPNTQAVRIYAPAMVTMPNAANVVFLPVAFVEHHMDLYLATVMGTNVPPEVVLKGYEGYFEQFIKGGYAMIPVVIRAGIEGKEHSVDVSTQPKDPAEASAEPAADDAELCPGCKATVADWQDHFPVLTQAGGDQGQKLWTCELRQPGLRETHPNYEPPHPSTVE